VVPVQVNVRVSPPLLVAGTAAAAALAVAGVHVAAGADYRVDGPVPRQLTVDGVHLTLDQQVPVVSVSSAAGDPSLVVVDVGPTTALDADACAAYSTVRVTEQDERRVRVAAYSYRVDDGTAPADVCAAPGFAGHVTIDLRSPLGDRRVVEDGTDRVLVLPA
jgi:hypothetical protein